MKRVRRDVPRLALNQQEAAQSLGIHFERHVRNGLPVVYCGSLKLCPRTGLQRWPAQNPLRQRQPGTLPEALEGK